MLNRDTIERIDTLLTEGAKVLEDYTELREVTSDLQARLNAAIKLRMSCYGRLCCIQAEIYKLMPLNHEFQTDQRDWIEGDPAKIQAQYLEWRKAKDAEATPVKREFFL